MATTILAVDDSATMRKALEITFARTELNLVTCDTAEAALAAVKTEQPALVIVDVSLPPSDGYELVTTLKLGAPTLPVLMLSSKQNPFDPTRGAQADNHIDKPFDTQILADRVREMVAAGAGAAKPAAAAAAPAAARPPAAAARPQLGGLAAQAARPAAPRAAANPLKETMPMGRSPEAAAPRTGGAAARPAAAAGKPLAGGLKAPAGAPAAAARPAGRPAAPGLKPAAPAARPSSPDPAAASGTIPGMRAGGGAVAPAAKAAEPSPRRGTTPSWPAAAPKGATPAAAVPAHPPVGDDVLAAASGDMASKLEGLGLSAEQVQGVLSLSREVIEQVVWEVVPTLAEVLIKEEIKRLTDG